MNAIMEMIHKDQVLNIPQSCPDFDSILSLIGELETEICNELNTRHPPRSFMEILWSMENFIESARDINSELREIAFASAVDADNVTNELNRALDRLTVEK